MSSDLGLRPELGYIECVAPSGRFLRMRQGGVLAAILAISAVLGGCTEASDPADHNARSIDGPATPAAAQEIDGTIAFVDMTELDPLTGDPLTSAEIQQIAHKLTDLILEATEGDMRLRPQFYQGSDEAVERVANNRLGDKLGDCIETFGPHTPSQVADAFMPEVKDATFIIGLGGRSCNVSYYEQGRLVNNRAAGFAHPHQPGRMIDIYTDEPQVNIYADQTEQLLRILFHEWLHLRGLDHMSLMSCPEGTPLVLTPDQSLDLNAYIHDRLGPACSYSEYGRADNIMGASSGISLDDQYGEILDPLQLDFLTDRAAYETDARSPRLYPGQNLQVAADRRGSDWHGGFIVPLTDAITYATPDEMVAATYRHLAFTLDTNYPDTPTLRMSLATDPNAPRLGMLEIGYFNPDGWTAGKTFRIGGHDLTITNRGESLLATMTGSAPAPFAANKPVAAGSGRRY